MARTRLPFCSPYRLFVSAVASPRTVADDVHEAYTRFIWRSMSPQHVALVGLLTALWPLLFVVMALLFTRSIGPAVRTTTGKGIVRQLWEQLQLATLYSIPPDKYYVFELFKDERRALANDYILRYELKGGIHNLMHRRAKVDPSRRITKGDLTDKLAFARRCRAGAVETPTIVAYLDRPPGAVSWDLHVESGVDGKLPPGDLFIKPAKGKGGRGCEKWADTGAGYRGPDGRILNAEGLLRHVAALAEKRGRYLIQECLENHPELGDLGSALTSLRITSCRNETGRFEVTNATLKLSFTPGKSVDNFHQGGGVAQVDVRTGIVGPASDSWKNRPCVWHASHPITGAPIAGRALPQWPETVAMVERAHALFPDRIMLGFDVAITDRGPVIIEGNVQSGCDMIQRTHDRPVGRQRLGQLLAFHASSAVRMPLPHQPIKWFGPLQYFRPR